jgi:single-strand DNA-binding protein
LNDLNHSLLEGNITKDPVTRYTPNRTPICTFTVASNYYYKNDEGTQRETSFFDVEAWGKLAEKCIAMAHKGRSCRVTGRLKQERWDGPDSKPRSKIIMVATSIEYKPEGQGCKEDIL